MADFTIREAGLPDVEELAVFAGETFWETYQANINHTDVRNYIARYFNREYITREIRDDSGTYYLLGLNGKLIGYARMQWNSVHEKLGDENACEINKIYVHSGRQGTGAGRYLMEFLLRESTKRHKDLVWLGVWENNVPAIGFYRYMGFEKIADIPFDMGSEIQNDYLMVKKTTR